MADLRSTIARQVHELVGDGTSARGDDGWRTGPGLFAPDAVARRVHGDFGTMMIGGLAALLMQMLHPGALAGVWDHSNFRRDSLGRLRRTAQFIAGTTYGSAAHAQKAIDRVRSIHDRVTGTLPDGTPYAANDPHLIAFVHVAGADAFLRAYLRYRAPLSAAEQNRYFAETAEVARRLGARQVPETRRGVDVYLRAIRPELVADARTRDVIGALLDQPPPSAGVAPFSRMMTAAGIDLLPDWARRMHGLSVSPLARPAVRAGALGTGGLLRWALAARATV